MYSNIVLTFHETPGNHGELNFIDTLTAFTMREVFEGTRLQKGQVENDEDGTIYDAMSSFRKYFNLDYNANGLYTLDIDSANNQLTISANNINSNFIEGSNTTGGAITSSITNLNPPIEFLIDSIVISEASINPCDKVKLTITTSDQADTISLPVNQTVTTNPFIIDVDRGDSINVAMHKSGVFDIRTLKIPKLLSSDFFANPILTPSNGAVTIDNALNVDPLFELEYSINNINWQKSNYFGNLSEGDYTAYVRDDIGCQIALPFSIESFTPNVFDYEPICEISNLNPIRYKQDVIWSDTVLKTTENTLSFEENVALPNTNYTQPFAKSDIIKTQIKTNYSTILALLISESGEEEILPITKTTANMEITDVRDGYVLAAEYNGTNYTAIKYNGGKVYDPLTLQETSNYNIGQNVPSWVNKDDYLNIEGVGWYRVLDIIYSDDAYVAIVNLQSNFFPLTLNTTLKITSKYNAVDWENFEFAIDFSSYEGYYKVKIDVADVRFGSKFYLSEWLNIRDCHNKTFLIEAYNSENNEINFSTGFSIKMRLPKIVDMVWKPNTEQEIYVTDTNTVTLQNKYRGFWEITSSLLPSAMAEKLVLILLQDRLFIDTVSYQSVGEIEGVSVGSQYQIKANLVKSNYVFDSNSNKGLGVINVEGTLLSISPNGGFLRVD